MASKFSPRITRHKAKAQGLTLGNVRDLILKPFKRTRKPSTPSSSTLDSPSPQDSLSTGLNKLHKSLKHQKRHTQASTSVSGDNSPIEPPPVILKNASDSNLILIPHVEHFPTSTTRDRPQSDPELYGNARVTSPNIPIHVREFNRHSSEYSFLTLRQRARCSTPLESEGLSIFSVVTP